MAKLPVKVLLDTNFLLVPIRFGVDIFSEIERVLNQLMELTVPTSVLKEIESLKREAGPQFQRELDFALSLASRCTIIEDTPQKDESVDDSLIRLATTYGCVVATTDSELRRRLREKGVKVVYMRQKRYLAIE